MKRKNKTNKNLFPDYILNSKKNIENEKIYIRNISNNYELDKFNNLCFKYYTEHTDKEKNKKKFKLMKIQFNKIIKIISNI